jgi:hypothetical protein
MSAPVTGIQSSMLRRARLSANLTVSHVADKLKRTASESVEKLQDLALRGSGKPGANARNRGSPATSIEGLCSR